MQSIDSTETYVNGMSEDLVSKKDRVKSKNVKKQYKND